MTRRWFLAVLSWLAWPFAWLRRETPVVLAVDCRPRYSSDGSSCVGGRITAVVSGVSQEALWMGEDAVMDGLCPVLREWDVMCSRWWSKGGGRITVELDYWLEPVKVFRVPDCLRGNLWPDGWFAPGSPCLEPDS